jgi:hypothetical protein
MSADQFVPASPIPPPPDALTQHLTAPFATHGCGCSKRHVPACYETEGHHIFPQALQIALYGAVRDKRLEYLCRDGHRSVHLYLNAVLTGQKPPRLNPFLREVAKTGIARITEAYLAAGRDVPGDGNAE